MGVSKVQAQWSGSLKEGKGSLKASSGFFDAPFTFASRFEGEPKGTNPEELLGAAHASCFSMFLAAQLTNANLPPSSIVTNATVHLGAGPSITKIELETVAIVPGIDKATFEEKVQFAKENCPVSKALTGVGQVTVSARLG